MGRGAFWLSSGNIIGQVIGVASGIIAARILGSESYGTLNLLRSSIDTITLFAGLALGVTANRYVALYRTANPVVAGRIIGMTTILAWCTSLVAAAFVFFGAEEISQLLHAPTLVSEIRIAGGLVLLSTLASVYGGILTGLESFKKQAFISLTVALIQSPLLVWGILTAGVIGGLLAMTASAALSIALTIRATKAGMKQFSITSRFSIDTEQRKILKEFTLPALMSAAMVIPVFWAGNVFLSVTSDGYHQLGLFSVANQWRQAILLLPNILSSISLPILTNLLGNSDGKEYTSMLRKNVLVVAVATIAPATILAILSPWIMKVYGNDFHDGWLVMSLLLLAAVLSALSNVFGQTIASSGRMWIGLTLNSLWAASFILMAWLLCPIQGAVGLATAYAASYAVHALASTIVARQLLRNLNPFILTS
jgi:O-antigen/teichoic acid export membrane protein